MIKTCSHLVIATGDVPRIVVFFSSVFDVKPHFENKMFAEFILENGFRIAFFRPVGASAKYFSAQTERQGCSFGVTVTGVESIFERIRERQGDLAVQFSGPPKDHPWGEKSFLLIDPDGNRWELTESPSADGMLVPRNFGK